MTPRFVIIGMDDCRTPYFTPEAEACIASARVFSGGKRHQEIVAARLPQGSVWLPVTVPLDAVFEGYRRAFAEGVEQIVVFASGDPLFFGFANTIRRVMPEVPVRVIPWFNSLQTLAHRLVMRYDDMRTVSLTGRPWQELDRALIERAPKIGVLTDRTHTPAAIAQRLLDYGYTGYTLYTGEHLGNTSQERIQRLSLDEAAGLGFEMPNCVMLVKEEADQQGSRGSTSSSRDVRPEGVERFDHRWSGSSTDGRQVPEPAADSQSARKWTTGPRPFGIPDEAFEHLDGRARMITKAPIRLLTLQALELQRRTVLWDIGFCTGSVSIEARLQFPHLQVVAFEVRPEGERLMRENSRRFGVPGITTLIGDFLQASLTGLPRPDAVFIGGHGGRLNNIVQRVRQVLLPGGCIVFNSVSAQSHAAFEAAAAQAGMTLAPATRVTIDDYNPIDILKSY